MQFSENMSKPFEFDNVRLVGSITFKLEEGQMEEIDRLGNFLGWPSAEDLCEILPFDKDGDEIGYYKFARDDLLAAPLY